MRGRLALVLILSSVVAACGGDGGGGASVPTTSSTSPPTSSPATSVAGLPLGLALASPGGPASGPVPVTVTLTNLSDAEVTVVRPFFTATLIFFRVNGPDGEPVPFDGPYADLAPLGTEQLVSLAPGESVGDDFDLSTHFTLPTGTVEVTAEYRNPTGGSYGGEAGLQFDAGTGPVSEPITIEVGG